MRKIVLFLFVIFSFQVFAQDIDIYKYLNLNDPTYQKNIELIGKETDINYEYATRYHNLNYSDAINKPDFSNRIQALRKEHSSQIRQVRAQYDKDGWEYSGLLTIYVSNNEEKAAAIKKIDEELEKLGQIRQQKVAEAAKSMKSNHPQVSFNNFGPAGPPARISAEYRILISRLIRLKRFVKIGEVIEPGIDEKENKLEAEFLAEIAQINKAIAYINEEARQKNVMAALSLTHALTHRLRIKMSGNWFYESLKKIRKDNPSFTFTIDPLAEEMTREHWIRMRKRADIAYRKAMEAHSGCVINEGIQTALKVEISMRALKTTFDLFNGLNGVLPKNFFGVLQSIKNHITNEGTIGRLVQQEGTMWIQKISKTQLVAEEIYKGARGANESAFDYKSYIGLVGTLMSAADGYKKVAAGFNEHQQQAGLIKANRQSAKNLMKSGREMMLQYDKYRAYIESKLWVIDRLHDQIERIKMDKYVAKDHWNKQSVWGKSEFMWDVEYYANLIDESGRDLENGDIYYEHFIKNLQIVIEQSRQDYMRIEEKVKKSGAPQNEIQAQLSFNSDNEEWFDNKIEELVMRYAAYGDKKENKLPEDMIHISHQVVPGVEDQNVAPKTKEVWEVEYEEEDNSDTTFDNVDQNNSTITQNDNPFSGSTARSSTSASSKTTTVSSGNGWQADKIENSPAAIEKAVKQAVQSSKTPVGLYIADDSDVKIYYVDGNNLGITSSTVQTYYDANGLQNGINNKINEGYFPMGISFTNSSKLHVLYIKGEVSATAWQLVESNLNLDEVSQNCQQWINQGYVPVGISLFNNMYYTLLVKSDNNRVKNWFIEGYNNGNIQQSINQNISNGLLPFGYLQEGEVINVLYVGF